HPISLDQASSWCPLSVIGSHNADVRCIFYSLQRLLEARYRPFWQPFAASEPHGDAALAHALLGLAHGELAVVKDAGRQHLPLRRV
ncbi:hypothetical protein RCL28_23715, partial [Salmonella enterica subsp. enterica serovar 1,4,[5],12:i:-]